MEDREEKDGSDEIEDVEASADGREVDGLRDRDWERDLARTLRRC